MRSPSKGLGGWRETELSANYISIVYVPPVVANCSSLAAMENLNPSNQWWAAFHQADCVNSYKKMTNASCYTSQNTSYRSEMARPLTYLTILASLSAKTVEN